jgi:hypothetical protein
MSLLNIISEVSVWDGTEYVVVPAFVFAGIAYLIARATN